MDASKTEISREGQSPSVDAQRSKGEVDHSSEGARPTEAPERSRARLDAHAQEAGAPGDARVICPGCKQEIDPDVCHCGEPCKKGYHDNHNPIPMGCDCGRLAPLWGSDLD